MFDSLIELEEKSQVPLYEQLYKAIVRQIRSGSLKAGERLPSKRQLCQMLHVSHSTVETAYSILSAEGYVEAKPRVGYTVSRLIPMAGSLAASEASGSDNDGAGKNEKPEESQRDQKVLSFSTGGVDTEIFPYSSWARIYKEVVYHGQDLLERGSAFGDENFRKVLSRFLNEYRGVNCRPDQLVIGAGVEYLLDMLMQLFKEEEWTASEDPGYPTFRIMAQYNGKKVVSVPVDQNGLVIEDLRKEQEKLLSSGEKGIALTYVTPSHQFPLGVTMPHARRQELLDFAHSEDMYLIEDDYDSEFRYRSRPLKSLQGIDPYGRVIYVGTFSRSVAPSIRIAFMVLPDNILQAFKEKFSSRTCPVSRFEQQVLGEFMHQGFYVRHLRRCTNVYKKRCQMLKDQLLEIPGASVTGDEAGLHFLLHLPGRASKEKEEELRAALEKEHVKVHFLNEYCQKAVYPETILVVGFAGLRDEEAHQAAGGLMKAVKQTYQCPANA